MSTISVPRETEEAGTEPSSARRWWKRRWVLVVLSLLVIVAAMVIADLPLQSSPGSNIAATQGVIAEVAADAAPCSYGVHEALGLYADVRSASLSASDRSEVPTLVSDDYEACSFTNANIDDLAGIQEPNSPLGRDLDNLASQTLTWCDTDGMLTVGYINELIQDPGSPAYSADLAKSERSLDAQRLQVEETIKALDRLLGTNTLPRIELVKVSEAQP